MTTSSLFFLFVGFLLDDLILGLLGFGDDRTGATRRLRTASSGSKSDWHFGQCAGRLPRS